MNCCTDSRWGVNYGTVSHWDKVQAPLKQSTKFTCQCCHNVDAASKSGGMQI